MLPAAGRLPRPRLLIAAGVTLLVLLVGLMLVSLGRAWAEEQAREERLLPGVTVASVDVGGLTVTEATAVLERELEDRLDTEIAILVGNRTWTTTARELGTAVDAPAAMQAAFDASATTGWTRVTAVRWLGADVGVHTDASLDLDEEALASLVAEVAERVDGEPVSATSRWTDAGAEVVDDIVGYTVVRDEALDALVNAVRDTTMTSNDTPPVIEFPTTAAFAPVRSADVAEVLPALDTAVQHTLDRRLSLREGNHAWSVAGRVVASEPDLEGATATAVELAAEGRSADSIAGSLEPIPLVADTHRLSRLLDQVASEVAIEPVDARVDYSSGWVEIVDAVEGHALDRDGAAEAVKDALLDGAEFVELPARPVEPERTRADYHDVLLVRQNERRLYHYRDGEIVASWPVAVGTGNQPTPTGVFTIGAKRHMPTWHNPAPDRWGSDMPTVIGPGPSNPLGVRALNWNRSGVDTLIRFHGTAQVSSIGRAASNGCVRLTNADVIDLYNRIPSGTTVVSLHG